MVILSKAPMAKAMLTGVTWSMGEPKVSLRQTTMSRPTKPKDKPSHWRGVTPGWSDPRKLYDSQIAVSTG
jgi:hypothetical protein